MRAASRNTAELGAIAHRLRMLVLVGLSLAVLAPAQAEEPSWEQSVYGIFGVYAVEYGHFMQRMGFDKDEYWRWADGHGFLLDYHLTRSNTQLIWPLIEPEIGGPYNWNNEKLTDGVIRAVYRPSNRIQWLGCFESGRTGGRDPLAHPDEYRRFVQDAVERYDGDGIDDAGPHVNVRRWQAGNEWFSFASEFGGRDEDDYIEFYRLIQEGAHAADPTAKIALIAGTSGKVEEWFEPVVAGLAAAGAPIDIADVHNWPPYTGWKMSEPAEMRAILDSYGYVGTEIWSSENGTWQGQPFGKSYQNEVQQASMLIKRAVWSRFHGLDRFFWNNLMEWYRFSGNPGSIFNSMGLITDGEGPGEDPERFNTERIAYWSYQMLIATTDTTVAEPLDEMPLTSDQFAQWGYRFRQRATGLVTHVLWADTGSRPLTFPVSTEEVEVWSMITDRFGNLERQERITAAGGEVTVIVDTAPLLVREIDCTTGAPRGVAATLRLTLGGADVHLDWFRSPSAAVAGYNVYRAESPASVRDVANRLGSSPTTAATEYADSVAGDPNSYFYLVSTTDDCGGESPP